jgi:uncharacterized protein YxeA
MKKALKILLAMTIVGSLFAVGFAGNAAADSQNSWQSASSYVNQNQDVYQSNSNYQDDNTAISAAGSFYGEAESGDAIAVQSNYQSNRNSQFAYSNAENENEQEWED